MFGQLRSTATFAKGTVEDSRKMSILLWHAVVHRLDVEEHMLGLVRHEVLDDEVGENDQRESVDADHEVESASRHNLVVNRPGTRRFLNPHDLG